MKKEIFAELMRFTNDRRSRNQSPHRSWNMGTLHNMDSSALFILIHESLGGSLGEIGFGFVCVCICVFVCCRFFGFLAVLEFELRASRLLGRCSTTWATPPALFALAVFHVQSHGFCPGQPGLQSSYLCLLHSWYSRQTPPHLDFLLK
jgi:hypothetical protein